MGNDNEQFRIVAVVVIVFVLCLTGLGFYCMHENVTSANSYGIDELWKILGPGFSGLLGMFATMAVQRANKKLPDPPTNQASP
jgi:Mn2+/Fe2+ NRAMP family transporter